MTEHRGNAFWRARLCVERGHRCRTTRRAIDLWRGYCAPYCPHVWSTAGTAGLHGVPMAAECALHGGAAPCTRTCIQAAICQRSGVTMACSLSWYSRTAGLLCIAASIGISFFGMACVVPLA